MPCGNDSVFCLSENAIKPNNANSHFEVEGKPHVFVSQRERTFRLKDIRFFGGLKVQKEGKIMPIGYVICRHHRHVDLECLYQYLSTRIRTRVSAI